MLTKMILANRLEASLHDYRIGIACEDLINLSLVKRIFHTGFKFAVEYHVVHSHIEEYAMFMVYNNEGFRAFYASKGKSELTAFYRAIMGDLEILEGKL